MSAKEQIALLRQDGYLDAVAVIERLSGSVNLSAEFEYLKAFAKQGCFDDEHCCEQLRALWTAYCFHSELLVDTAPYDNDLRTVWSALVEKDWSDFDSFDNFMCTYLV